MPLATRRFSKGVFATSKTEPKIGHESAFVKMETMDCTADNWVSDAAGVLSRDQFTALNGMINRLYATHGVELAVVTLPGRLPQTRDRQIATKLFNHWQVGDTKHNNGLLVVLSGLSEGRGQRKLDIVTGDGARRSGVFSDGFHRQLSPQASASIEFQAQTAIGKLKAVMIPTVPSGCQFSRIAWR